MNTEKSSVWTIYTDASSCNTTKRTGIGVVIFAPDATEPTKTIWDNIPFCTSHAAEYSAVIRGLQEVRKRGAQTVELRSDLKTMVAQLRGEAKVNAAHLKPMYTQATEEMTRFALVNVVYIERTLNGQADKLAKNGISKGVPKPVVPTPVVAKPIVPKPVAAAPEPTPAQFYKPVGNELWLWNTERLWHIAEKLPAQIVPVADLEAHLDSPGWFGDEPLTLRRVAQIARAVQEADADKPLVICGDELLDGRFRLAKAVGEGKTEVTVKRLAHLPAPCARYPLRYAP